MTNISECTPQGLCNVLEGDNHHCGELNALVLGHPPTNNRDGIEQRLADVERPEAGDIADAIAWVVTRPRHVAVNEVLVRPTEQPY